MLDGAEIKGRCSNARLHEAPPRFKEFVMDRGENLRSEGIVYGC